MNKLSAKIINIKQRGKKLNQKRTLLQIEKLRKSANTESQQEIAKAIKQLDLIATQITKHTPD